MVRRKLKILEVGSEVAPLARTGGLGDVLGALPLELARLGHEVVVALPHYGSIDPSLTGGARPLWSGPIKVGESSLKAEVVSWTDEKTGVTFWLIGNKHFFDRPELYRDQKTGEDYEDNDERFIFFSRAVVETLLATGFIPDVAHCHDWQAGLIPTLLKHDSDYHADLPGVKTLATIHNLGYPGIFPRVTFDKLNLPEELLTPISGALEFYDGVNFLKGAILSADKINTVSKSYAQEIQTKEYGAGLEGVLTDRVDDLSGIINGVDYSVWSPSVDRKIPYRYYRSNLGGKWNCRVELLGRAGLPIREKVPLIGIISRLADQKGFDLIAEAAERIFALPLQMILLGTGEAKYHELFTKLEQDYPDKLKAYLTFDDGLAHQIEAGSDIFLMPSRYEPCGLNQLYSLKYGTVPIVRRVGGLADTVIDYDPDRPGGTGFVFEEYSPEALLKTVERALKVYQKRRAWLKLVKEGMSKDFSWSASALEYEQLMTGMVD